MTAKIALPAVPPALADVALVDPPTVAAARGVSLSTLGEMVRRGEAPQPVIRSPRCTRWRMSDIRTWLIQTAERGTPDGAAAVMERAVRASRAAKAKRAATAQKAA